MGSHYYLNPPSPPANNDVYAITLFCFQKLLSRLIALCKKTTQKRKFISCTQLSIICITAVASSSGYLGLLFSTTGHKDIKQQKVLSPKLLIYQTEATENKLEGWSRYDSPSLVQLCRRTQLSWAQILTLSLGHPAWQHQHQRQADTQRHQRQKYQRRKSCLSWVSTVNAHH